MIGISKLYCGTVEASDPLRYGRSSKDLPSHLLQFSADKKPVVVWNITSACTLKCVHCYAAAGKAGSMALTTAELEFAFAEARRVLRPNGLHIYTVRTTEHPHYGAGIFRGEGMYEVDGFVVHFFDREKVARLATGDEIVRFFEFEEGDLPRRLFFVAMRKGGMPGGASG